MSKRAEALATAFERANDDVVAAVEDSSDEQWRRSCEGEGWSVAVAAHHVAVTHASVLGLVQIVANGQEMPAITMDMINAGNAQHAEAFANVSREDTLDILRRDVPAITDTLRDFTDEQLDRSAPMAFAGGATWSAADLIERILIAHPLEHGASIRAALDAD